MPNDSVFDPATAPVTTPESAPASSSVLDALVGEGKKFKTVDDLAKGKMESDAFIARLQEEMADLRKEADRIEELESQLEEIRQRNSDRANEGMQPKVGKDNTSPSLSESDIETLVQKALTKAETNRTATENILEANRKMIEAVGSKEKAQEAVAAASTRLGLSIDYLKNIAATSPTAFLNLMGTTGSADNKAPAPSAPHGTVNPMAELDGNKAVKPGTKAYYDAMRRKDRRLYFSAKVQQEIFEAVKNGTY